MLLRDIPRESPLKVKIEGSNKWTKATFHHLDGMYSYCTTDSGLIFHLHNSQPLELKNGIYYLA